MCTHLSEKKSSFKIKKIDIRKLLRERHAARKRERKRLRESKTVKYEKLCVNLA